MSALDEAIARYTAGDRAAARHAAEAVLAAAPDDADALNLLAIIAQEESRHAEAEALARRAVAISPDPVYLNTLGNGLLIQGRADEALSPLQKAHDAAPDQADILFNLANAQRETGRFDAALESYRRTIAARPAHVGAHNNLALLLKAMGDPEAAAAVFAEAIALAPNAPELRFNLGNALYASGNLGAAERAYGATLALAPSHAEAQANLGVVLREMGRKAEAERSFRTAIGLDPDLVPAYVGLADLADDGTMDAVAHRAAVLAMKPDLAPVRSSLLMCMQYDPGFTREAMLDAHKAYGSLHASARAPSFAPDHDFTPHRPLRLGVVSGDFRFHAMAFFALPLFEARARDAWSLVCYSTTPRPDAHTAGFRAAADHWRDVGGLDDGALTDLIVRDRIDILVDLSGHTPHNRLPVFAAKPAPLQVAWGDYVDTRGLSAIDILLYDAVHIPSDERRFYVERVVPFAPDYIAYRPPPYAPPLASAPCERNGTLTFGSFSETTKIGRAAIARWAEVLRAVPDARFLLNGRLLADDACRQRLIGMFADAGIAGDRLIVRTGGTHAEFLAQYAEVDVILDTTPYSGGLTTCEALLMGVPVITIPGERLCGRHSTAHLTRGGYPEGVARSPDEFVAKAVALAARPQALTPLRAELRRRFLASRVCDVGAFAGDFYGTLRREWDALCRRAAGR